MDKPELARLRFPCITGFSVDKPHLEEGVVVSGMVILWPCSELLISRHRRRRDIMGKKMALGDNVKKLNDILVANDPPTPCLWESFRRNDLPKVICVIMSITSDLLSCKGC